MNKKDESQKADVIQIIIKSFLYVGYALLLGFGSVYYLAYIFTCKIMKTENKYNGFNGFNKHIKSIVFSDKIKNNANTHNQRARIKKTRKEATEYISRPNGRQSTGYRQIAESDKTMASAVDKQKNHFFKRLFMYAAIFFLSEDVRREKTKEIDQKYPPRIKKEKADRENNARPATARYAYPAVQNLEYQNEDKEDPEKAAKRTLMHRKIMITSLSVIISCVVIFVGAMAYAQELPDGFNIISSDPTASLFETMVPVEQAEYCEVLPDDEINLYLEYSEEEIESNTNESVSEGITSANTSSEPVMSGNITTEAKIFKEGDEDPEIANIQARLMELHYMSKDTVTNYYGKNTVYAMGYFQRQHGLQADGSAGADTLAVLYSDEAEEYTVKEGTEGADVKEIQQRLYDLKYLSSKSYITGYFGSKTKDAVEKFQSRNSLSSDGVIGYNTHRKLFSSSAIKNSTSSSGGGGGGATGNGTAADIVTVAKSLRNQGYIYVWGGKSPADGGFDCSGFVYYVLNQAGISTGYRDSSAWASTSSFTTIESIDNLKAGDICVFKGHVGIYIGDMKMIHSTSWSGGSGITITSIDTDYRRENWIWGKRIVN